SFSPQGGTVRITAKRLRHAVEIMVDDDGPGIQPEAIERIFERFYTDRPHQGFGQNSGLGLSISRQIVEAHSGRIRAENRMGAARGPEGPQVVSAAPRPAMGPKRRRAKQEAGATCRNRPPSTPRRCSSARARC